MGTENTDFLSICFWHFPYLLKGVGVGYSTFLGRLFSRFFVFYVCYDNEELIAHNMSNVVSGSLKNKFSESCDIIAQKK